MSKRFHERPNPNVVLTKRIANRRYDEMSYEDKRALAEMVFAGKLPDGRRMGIYVCRFPGQERKQHRRWNYTIHGQLIEDDKYFPREGAFEFGAMRQDELISKARRSSTLR